MTRTAIVVGVVTALFVAATGYLLVLLPRVEATIGASILGIAYGASFVATYRTVRRWLR